MDFGWCFALGHAWDTEKDYGHGTGYFSYVAKTGYGDGPAAADFDDRAWRVLDIPHDWVVELLFNSTGSHSHGYYAIGRHFPENSVGWYRKKFFIPASDLGRRMVIEFDGVHRNVTLFINGFYIGREPSGYSSFQYDITDYLNYGGNNVIAVRVDATMEEGWFYEGAGIYRHVWLTKTAPLHVAQYGTFVTSEIKNQQATVTARATIINEGKAKAAFDIIQTIRNASGDKVASQTIEGLTLEPGQSQEYPCVLEVKEPHLWSVESPYLYTLLAAVRAQDAIVDIYEISFGIRSVHFDPDKGFFLNGQHVLLKGTNNHQDHAGVGTAIPEALQAFRIKTLKAMGSNAYRCSHNPPTPELLEACDRLGMLVIDENRLMGTSPEHLRELKRMILRDRNHPCVILWSLGNEEWAIEGNIKGARITSTMQAFAQQLDPTRRITVAVSGGRVQGISTVVDVMGYNYLEMGDIDEHHEKYPNQPMLLTEERTTSTTRGIYEDDPAKGYMAPSYLTDPNRNIENGIHFCAERPFMAGLFFWTGFDYRGEANPYGWPQVIAQYGVVDLCGFAKDSFYYLQSWWTDGPVLALSPHWNWPGKEGQVIKVRTYSNCDTVELRLNDQSLGRKSMPRLSHIEWDVPYEPGTLLARGYKNGKEIMVEQVETIAEPAAIRLVPDRSRIRADREDVSIITVQVEDTKGRIVPVADNEIAFRLEGPGRIIGVGNGNPSSHAPEQFLDTIKVEKIRDLKMAFTTPKPKPAEVEFDANDSNWADFKQTNEVNKPKTEQLIIVRGSFALPALTDAITVALFTKSICENQTLYVNGRLIAKDIKRNAPNQDFLLDHAILREGTNIYAVTGTPFTKTHRYENLNTDPGVVQVHIPAETWKRKAFNGLAQIIVQAQQQPGTITLHATSEGLQPAAVKIRTVAVTLRPTVPDYRDRP